MPRVIRNTLLSARDLAVTVGPFVLIALVLLIGAYFVLQPNPPRRVVLATGPEQSDYAEFGKRYAAALKKHHIEVVLRPTQGSSANRRLLRDAKEKVDFGFVRGGSSEVIQAEDEKGTGLPLVTLGSLFFEPVWIFYRTDAAKKLPGKKLERLDQLRGWRVNTGGRGAGSTNLLSKLISANGLNREDLKIERLDLTQSAIALFNNEIDAMTLVSAPESPILQMLLRTPGISLFEFTQAEAYSRRFGYLSAVTLPRGIADFAHDVPAHDVQLIAPTSMLVAREGTHPALVQLFVQAARDIHAEPGWFAKSGQFPSKEDIEFPLAPEAERFLRNGPPLMQRYLPFWLANLIDRMWVAMISIIAILIPLARVVPPLYAFRIRSRVFRWYRQLRQIEDSISAGKVPPAQLLEELNKLDAKAERISVPLSYTDELYSLRSHIALVRERLTPAA
ncbi:MAG: C4-dicarboxylate ABC transporter substrate-binding protein [Betaproteobacteria bacterium]|nr:C4-dicarboxylate ABC transporter substrate-binding protein [Betaproteobacteria bacterium]